MVLFFVLLVYDRIVKGNHGREARGDRQGEGYQTATLAGGGSTHNGAANATVGARSSDAGTEATFFGEASP